ncbi:MAG: DNA-directed DNA polymerase [Candidatus Diapherotrites archaeon]
MEMQGEANFSPGFSKKAEGMLLDCDYETKNGESRIQLYIRSRKGIEKREETSFKPYFFVVLDSEKSVQNLEKFEFEGGFRALKVEKVKKENAEHAYKLSFQSTEQLVKAREQVKEVEGVLERREYDIPFVKRFLIDEKIRPFDGIEWKDGKAKSFESKEKPNWAAIDIETANWTEENEIVFSGAEKDPILMISYVDNDEEIVYSYHPGLKGVPFCQVFDSEKEMLEAFARKIAEKSPHALLSYNGDQFDFPYLRDRAKALGTKFEIFGEAPKTRKYGLTVETETKGIPHIDVYKVMLFLARVGAVDFVKFDLETVYEKIFGEQKLDLDYKDFKQYWEKGGKKLHELAEYNKQDSKAVWKLANEFLPMFVELSKLTRIPLQEVTRHSTGNLVEQMLLLKSFELNVLAPNKPHGSEMDARSGNRFSGALVKEPTPGVHENIAVLDFKSYHPSIVISHNIGPDTVNCSCCPGKDFCEQKKSIVALVCEDILKKRVQEKAEMKKQKEGSQAYKTLDARQYALKIVLNSVYGYLGFAGSRWYNAKVMQTIYKFVRDYISSAIEKAEGEGFQVIYSDTDSMMIVMGAHSEAEVRKFVQSVNRSLPAPMELELDKIYKRGIFVTKRGEDSAAKKRYALIDQNGSLKIVGFEYVRRDWSGIAKETQKEVIQAVLEEGKPEKAVEIVRKAVQKLQSGKALNKELVVYTQIQKPLKQYDVANPAVWAAKKGVEKGKRIGVGSIVGFIITKKGKSISEKAELEEFVKEGNYDASYYIENQVLPSVIKILRELGYSETDLLHGGKQTGLAVFK